MLLALSGSNAECERPFADLKSSALPRQERLRQSDGCEKSSHFLKTVFQFYIVNTVVCFILKREMFWYYLQSQTNKALLVSKNLKSILVGEKPICVCIYIYILYVVFLCCAYPTVLAAWKTRVWDRN